MIFEKIRERLNKANQGVCHLCGCDLYSEDAIDIINQVEAEYNNGWISVDDRLPKNSGKYLVAQKRYSISDRELKKVISIETDFVEFNARDNKWSRARFLQVTHWQPLPQPPKGE